VNGTSRGAVLKLILEKSAPGKNTLGKNCLARGRRQRRAGIEGRSLRFLGREYPGERQRVVDAEASTNGGLAVSENIVSKTDSRFEIAQCGIAVEELLYIYERSAGSQDSQELVVRLCRIVLIS